MPTTSAPIAAPGWEFVTEPPADWAALVAHLDASFFHTPGGLRVGAPFGEPLYGRWSDARGVGALALGVASRCRLSGRSRHAYFPSPPAVSPGTDRQVVENDLVRAMQQRGFAELGCDSFDAGSLRVPVGSASRSEYVVTLADLRMDGTWPPNSNHRRAIRRGDREGWIVRDLEGAGAASALHQVSATVVARAAVRGAPFSAELPAAAGDPAEWRDGGAVRVRAAYRDDELLAAILLGLSARRAFYVMGGATVAGYSLGASAWLHARAMRELATAGYATYNLGGVPAGALDPDDPSHGLHRFKSGFGAVPVACRNRRWVLQRRHLLGHRLLSWLGGPGVLPGVAPAHHA